MNKNLVVAILFVVVVYLMMRLRHTSSKPKPLSSEDAKEKESPEVVYQGLRNMVLYGTRERFGLPSMATPDTPWGVVMDWGVANGTATVMALSDGSASIYLSGGGGYIGGQKQEAIRKAALIAVATAEEFREQMTSTTDYNLPATGEVIFYALSDAGVRTASGREMDLRDAKHPLAKLGAAMQNIVTQYRILEEFKK